MPAKLLRENVFASLLAGRQIGENLSIVEANFNIAILYLDEADVKEGWQTICVTLYSTASFSSEGQP